MNITIALLILCAALSTAALAAAVTAISRSREVAVKLEGLTVKFDQLKAKLYGAQYAYGFGGHVGETDKKLRILEKRLDRIEDTAEAEAEHERRVAVLERLNFDRQGAEAVLKDLEGGDES